MRRELDLREDPGCQLLIEALRGCNRSLHHALSLYSADQRIETLRRLSESAIISRCAAVGTPDDEALCCARLILGSESSVTVERTIDGVLRGAYRSEITSRRLSGAGPTLYSLKQKLQSRTFGREHLGTLLNNGGLVSQDDAREGCMRLLMASAGRAGGQGDTTAGSSSSLAITSATTAPLQPLVLATTASTPASSPQLSAGERSLALLGASLLRDTFGGSIRVTTLCDALYAADAKAQATLRAVGGATKWLQFWPDLFSCTTFGTTTMVSLSSGSAVEEALARLAARLLVEAGGVKSLTALCNELYDADPRAKEAVRGGGASWSLSGHGLLVPPWPACAALGSQPPGCAARVQSCPPRLSALEPGATFHASRRQCDRVVR